MGSRRVVQFQDTLELGLSARILETNTVSRPRSKGNTRGVAHDRHSDRIRPRDHQDYSLDLLKVMIIYHLETMIHDYRF